MHTHKQFIDSLPQDAIERVQIVGRYSGSLARIQVRCRTHRLDCYPIAGELKRGNIGCKACARSNLSAACKRGGIADALRERFPGFTLPDHIETWHESFIATCPAGHALTKTASNMIREKHGCRKCANATINRGKLLDPDDFVRRARALHGNIEMSMFEGTTKPIWFRCEGCLCQDGKWVQAKTLLQPGLCRTMQARRTIMLSGQKHTARVGTRVFKYRGYELFALKELARRVPTRLIKHDKDVKPFRYRHAGRTSIYYPDFELPNKVIVEVKSRFTFGQRDKSVYDRNRAKARAVTAAGYRFVMFLYEDKGAVRVKLPANWWELTHVQIVRLITPRQGSRPRA